MNNLIIPNGGSTLSYSGQRILVPFSDGTNITEIYLCRFNTPNKQYIVNAETENGKKIFKVPAQLFAKPLQSILARAKIDGVLQPAEEFAVTGSPTTDIDPVITYTINTSSTDNEPTDHEDLAFTDSINKAVSGCGSIIIDDISPSSKTIKIMAESKNLINHSFSKDDSTTLKKDDGQVSLGIIQIKPGLTYCFSGFNANIQAKIILKTSDMQNETGIISTDGTSIILDTNEYPFIRYVELILEATKDQENVQPQFEIGDAPTAFSKYVTSIIGTKLNINNKDECRIIDLAATNVKSYYPVTQIDIEEEGVRLTCFYNSINVEGKSVYPLLDEIEDKVNELLKTQEELIKGGL